MNELLIYKASAGSGKTFRLAVEYMKLLVQYPRAYKNILAVTFTNKATGEMKERILSQLYGIWMGDKDSKPYLNVLTEETRLSPQEVRNGAGEALTNMLHDYSHFRVETIDSFFQSVMRNLARELELSPNLNIELSQDEVLGQAVDSMIEKLQPNSPMLAWLLDYINEKIANDKRWNVSDEIKKFGKNIFNEEYIEKGGALREKLKQPETIRNYKNTLNAYMTQALKQMEEYSNRFDRILQANNLEPDDLSGKKNGVSSYFNKLRRGNLKNDIRNATAEKCLANAENWAAKTSKRRQEIIALAEAELMPLLHEAESARAEQNVTVNSCNLSLQHLNKLQLLAGIDEEVRELNRENNRFLLSDTNALLHSIIRDDDSSFVFEKIGSSIRNVMIDEFQDTSRMQWGNFRLLLMEGLAQGADSLIVGDVKQSIYRWRNGDWGILNGLSGKIGNFPINVQTLRTNRRSETNIIKFNNDFFSEAVDYLNAKHIDELNEPCEPLLQAYADTVQESPRSEQKGYIKVEFVEPDEENDYNTLTIKKLAEEVQRLLDAGVEVSDMAILVRKNSNIPPIAAYFDKEMKCRVVSDEAFRLDASQAINLMMAALRHLVNPNDRVAQAQLILSYQNGVLKSYMDRNKLIFKGESEFLPPAFLDNREKLRLMPLYELLEELFAVFEMGRIENQDAYLFSFFDEVTAYLEDHSSDLVSFIAYWDEKLCSRTIPGGEVEGIRIFSIHKSKGLEFHTVLIPFCDWKLENETMQQLVWCSPKTEPYNEVDIVPVTYSAVMAESVYREDYLEERLQLWVDKLNLLYVAFTRAGKNLIMWSRKNLKGTMGELLSGALPNVAIGNELEWDDDEPFEMGEICPTEAEKRKDITNKLLQKPVKLPVRMQAMRHDIKFRQSNRSADFIAGVDDEESDFRFINRGRLLHALFSAIKTADDVDAAIDRLLFEGVIESMEQKEELKRIVDKAFAMPRVQEWYDGSWKLFNECSIIYKGGEGLQMRVPDRVMMCNDRVVVVDFKFGKRRAGYRAQVREYMQLLGAMGYANIEGFLWYVDEEIIEEVTEE